MWYRLLLLRVNLMMPKLPSSRSTRGVEELKEKIRKDKKKKLKLKPFS